MVHVAERNRLFARIALARRVPGIGNQLEQCATGGAENDHADDNAHP